jgi:tRNA (cmo5U34)-methyltransferase
VLVDVLPPAPERVLDLACGDGRLAALVLEQRPSVTSLVATDISPPMLELARQRFADDARVQVLTRDLVEPIDDLGPLDLVVTGFAVHHLDDAGKRALFGRVAAQLAPGGAFLNLEVVASATPERHADFLEAIGRTADDPEDRLAPVEDQLAWMGEAGLTNADCLWRWRGFALLAAEAPAAEAPQPSDAQNASSTAAPRSGES